MAVVDELVAVLGFDLRGEGDLRRFNQGLDRAERNAQAVTGRLRVLGAAAAAAATVAAAGAAKLAQSVISVSAEFETFEATLTTIEGSSEAARTSLDWISDFASETPYEISQLTEAFVRLRSYGIDPIANDALRTLGDASSALGKPLMQSVEALSDAATFQFERLREFGITTQQVGDEVTFRWSENGEDITRTVQKSGEEIRTFLLDNFGSRFSGAMEQQSRTFVGITGNMRDGWTQFQRAIGDAGFFEAVKGRLAQALEAVRRLDDNGTLDRIARGVSNAFVATMETVESFAMLGWDIAKAFYAVADAVVSTAASMTGMSKGMAAFGIGAGAVAATMTGRAALKWLAARAPAVAAFLALEDIASEMRGDASYIGSLDGGSEAVERLRGALDELKGAFANLRTALEGMNLDLDLGILTDPEAFLNRALVDFVDDLADAIGRLSAAINSFSGGDVLGGLGNLGFDFDTDDIGFGAVGAIRRRFAGEPTPADRVQSGFDGVEQNNGGMLELRMMLENMNGHLAGMTPESAVQATITDARVSQDQRQFPMTTSVTVNQTVSQPSSAPGAVGQAVGNAAANAVTAQRGRIASTPTTSGNGPQ